MFRSWSNIASSNARTAPPKEHIVSRSTSSSLSSARSDRVRNEQSGIGISPSDKVEGELSGVKYSPSLQNNTHLDPEGSFDDGEMRNGMTKQERLEVLNRGNHNGKWAIDETLVREGENWHFCRALTSQMGLSERGRVMTWQVFKQMDMRTYRSIEPGESKEKMKQFLVAFCVGALIYNRIHREYEWTDNDWKYYPGRTPPEKSRRYRGPKARLRADRHGDKGDRHRTIERCAESLGFSESQIRSCIEKVRTKMPAWAVPT